MATDTFYCSCKHTWRKSAKNTMWCVIGCAIGDFGTILFFQLSKIPFPVLGIMILVPIMLMVGFLTPWPYNYWRLKKFNQACH